MKPLLEPKNEPKAEYEVCLHCQDWHGAYGRAMNFIHSTWIWKCCPKQLADAILYVDSPTTLICLWMDRWDAES